MKIALYLSVLFVYEDSQEPPDPRGLDQSRKDSSDGSASDAPYRCQCAEHGKDAAPSSAWRVRPAQKRYCAGYCPSASEPITIAQLTGKRRTHPCQPTQDVKLNTGFAESTPEGRGSDDDVAEGPCPLWTPRSQLNRFPSSSGSPQIPQSP